MGAPKTLGFLRYFNNRRLKQPLRLSDRYLRWDLILLTHPLVGWQENYKVIYGGSSFMVVPSLLY